MHSLIFGSLLPLSNGIFGGFHCVGDEHGHSHGADSARNRCNGRCDFGNLVEGDIADQPLTTLFAAVRHSSDSTVDDHCARLDPGTFDQFGGAGSGDDDVRLLAQFGQISRFGVGNGHRGVGPQEQLGHGRADDFAPADDQAAGTLHFGTGFGDELHASVGSAGQETFRRLYLSVEQFACVEIRQSAGEREEKLSILNFTHSIIQ